MSASQSPTVRLGQNADQEATQEVSAARTRKRAPTTTGEAPLVLDRYRLHKRLGQGGFGTVWAAYDERLEREVAVKILPRERIVGGRFEREARAAARLGHPAIVTLYEAAVDDDGAYLVSELVRGGTLAKALDGGKLSDREILLLGITLCEALEHAHAEGVIHRDIKPSNILLPARTRTAGTGNAPAKLTDFGVARVVGGDSLTRTGDVLGTAAYMAPEQAEGLAAGPEADLYSLALVLYEALTGVNPVRTSTSASRARRLGAHLPPLRRQRRDLPRELGAGIDLALRPRPGERGTIDELRAALEISADEASDVRGVVTAPWRPTRPTVQAGAARPWQSSRPAPEDEELAEPWAPSRRQPVGAQDPPPRLDLDGSSVGLPRPLRAAAAAAGAAVAWWPAYLGMTPMSIPVAAYALIGGLVTMIAPLMGYVALTMLLTVTTAASGHAGAAVVLLALLVLGVALLPGRAALWPLPAGAVALGALGLAGAWPAAAGRIAGSVWRRAALGALGPVWLATAGEFAGRAFYVKRPPHAPLPLVWTASVQVTVHRVIGAIATPQVLAAALVWALAAAVLPWLASGRRRPALEFVAVALWAALTASGTAAALDLNHHHRAPPSGVAVLGAVLSAIIALWPVLIRVRREAAQSGRAEPGLP